MKKKTLAVLASAVIAAVFATSVEAKTILRMATDVSRDNSQAVGAEHFAKLVAEKTNGDVQIKFYPDGTLGSLDSEGFEFYNDKNLIIFTGKTHITIDEDNLKE